MLINAIGGFLHAISIMFFITAGMLHESDGKYRDTVLVTLLFASTLSVFAIILMLWR